MQLTDRQSSHALVVLALLSLFSFVGIGDKQNQWLWISLRLVGCGTALSAVYGYSKHEWQQSTQDDHTRLLDAAGEVKQGYDWQLHNLQHQHQRQVQQYEQAIAQLHQQLQLAEQTSAEQLSADQERLAVDYNRLLEDRDRLVQEQALLDEHFAAQQQALEAKQLELDEREADLARSFQEQFQAELTQLAQKEAEMEERERLMLQGFEQAWAEREEFYAQIADAAIKEAHSLKQPDYPQGHSHEELLACDAIRCLHEHGIVVKSPVVQGLKGGRFELRFKILPVLIDGKITSPVRSLGEAFKQINRDLIKPLRIAVRGCCADPIVEPIDSGLKLTFDVSGTDWDALEQERKAQADAIAEPDPAHLLTFIQSNPQVCLMGDSGEGKTTLINHLIRLMESDLGAAVELVLTNPKPNEETDLSKLKYVDFETSIFGLLEAATEILYRLNLNTNALLKRREIPDHPLPQFTPVIYFFDEFSELAGVWNRCKPDVMEAVLQEFASIIPPEKLEVMSFIEKRVSPSSFAADLLKFCWRVGRTEKVKLLIAGQNLKAGTIGTTIQDLHQTAIIYLGEAIREGIDNRVSSWQRESLNQEYAHRSRKVAEGRVSRFYGLFVPKGSRSYFSTLPDVPSPSDAVQLPEIPAPSPPPLPEQVQELERLWQLPSDERTAEDCTRTDAVQREFDPLDPEISPALTEAVLKTYDAYKVQTKVIEIVWNVPKSGTSSKYRAAKWKFRRILKKHNRSLPGKPWGADPDDLKNFSEVIQP